MLRPRSLLLSCPFNTRLYGMALSLSTQRLLLLWSIVASTTFAQDTFAIANFTGLFAANSGVLQSLKTTSESGFDFSPSDVFHLRNNASQYHTGDLTFRYRTADGSTWQTADTASTRGNVTVSDGSGCLLSTDLTPTLSGLTDGVQVQRKWMDINGDIGLVFTITNSASQSIELGGLGMPIEMNNIFSTRTAVETMNHCVLVDPYIGLHAGYAQVTRLTGTGPALVITPLNAESKFEAWRFLNEPDDDGPLGYEVQTYEGNYAWEIYTKAWVENEWNKTEPWNAPTSKTLAPGESTTFGLRFTVADQIQHIEDTVHSVGSPLAVGIPGYIVPQGLDAKLFVHAAKRITSIATEPAGALHLTASGDLEGHWVSYDVQAAKSAFGRVRVLISYTDNTTHSVHYWVAHESTQALTELGNFLTTDQWYTNIGDPFGRAPSVISYNRTANNYALNDNRTWIAGLSDEGGAGSFLAAGMKQSVWPVEAEISKLEEMVDQVVWGRLQVDNGRDIYAVRKSLFYYEPELVPGYDYDGESGVVTSTGRGVLC